MANIVINEVSQNYTYNIGNSQYASVALPITSSWGPGYYDPEAEGVTADQMLEYASWSRFPANQKGLEAFVSTYRGPAANYRLVKDYSYQMAMTLLTAGYDVLVCRLCPGTKAQGTLSAGEGKAITFKAKYPGSFGNNLFIELRKITYAGTSTYWNLITYVVDSSGIKTSVENIAFVFDLEHSSDNLLQWSEVESAFVTLTVNGVTDADTFDTSTVLLVGGTDKAADAITEPKNVKGDATPTPTTQWVTGYRKFVAETDDGKVKYKYDTTDKKFVEDAQVEAENAYVASRFKLNTPETAVAYDSSATYEVGAYCIQSDTLYKCNTAITEAEEFTPAHWTEQACLKFTLQSGASVGFFESGAVASTSGTTNYLYVESSETDQLNESIYEEILALASARYAQAGYVGTSWTTSPYYMALETLANSTDTTQLSSIKYKEWLFTQCTGTTQADGIYSLLKDKLTYNPNRIISPGWDDQDVNFITDGNPPSTDLVVSPMHKTILDTAYYSRCATGYIDIPSSLPRSDVWNDTTDKTGYAQKLARYSPAAGNDVNNRLFSSHCALFAPWGQYVYVGTSRMSTASPAFQALMIQRAQILNQALQYEWALPTNRKHNLNLGKLAYNVPKKLLDQWQSLEGVGVNVITDIPDLGTNIWGNSTLYEVPPATYQALANLSTRLLVNAVEDVVYRCGISITFQYNNDQAYNKFYAGVTPILDTMRNVGAIDDYYVTMSADINGLDQVNANTVIGKIYLVVNGVINDIIVDLIALPPSVDLDQFRS